MSLNGACALIGHTIYVVRIHVVIKCIIIPEIKCESDTKL